MAARHSPGLLTITRARLVLVGVAAVSVALVGLVVAAGRGDDGTGGERGATVTSGLLGIELTTMDGDTIPLAHFAGDQPMVVNFFASWCGPCVREMPEFEAVHARRGNEVRFLGVNLQDDLDDAAELVERTGVTYEIVRDEQGELFRAVNGFSMPTTVFLDAEGAVVEVHGGALSEGALEQGIDRLVGR